MQGGFSSLQSNLSDVEDSFTSLTGDFSSLETSLQSLEGNFTDLEGDVTDLGGNVSSLEGNVADLAAYDQAAIDIAAKLDPSIVLIVSNFGGGYTMAPVAALYFPITAGCLPTCMSCTKP